MRKMLSDLILDSGSAPTGKHALSLSCIFRLGHFLKSKIYDRIFLTKYYIITILKKFLERYGLWPVFNKGKKIFPIVFSNLARKGFFFLSQARKHFFCQMACIYLVNSRGVPKVLILTSHIFIKL